MVIGGVNHDLVAGSQLGKEGKAPSGAAMCGEDDVPLLSGLGATTCMELCILYSKVHDLLSAQGLEIVRPYVGNYFTSLDMGGVTLTVLKLDDELAECVLYPCQSMGLTQH